MTENQAKLVALLTTAAQWKVTTAKFSGDRLDCVADVTSGGYKIKKQKFSFRFDDPASCFGSRLVPGSCRGAYSEHYAAAAAKIIFEFSAAVGQEVI